MHSYKDTKDVINSLFDDCQSERGFSPEQSLCFIEEEYFPWNTNDTTWQLCFYVLLLKTALERGVDKLSLDLDYIGHKARELLNNELSLDKSRTELTKYESECLASDIYQIKINFL
jgi:hypothetical protein